MTQISRSPDAEALTRVVADELAQRLCAVQEQGRVPRLVLTGGTIATRIYGALRKVASPPDWSRVEWFWGDERYVAPGSEDRNEGQAHAALLDHVETDPDLVHTMPADDGTYPDLDAAAASYSDLVRGIDEFDVVLLGLGDDAHLASLAPGSDTLQIAEPGAIAVTGFPKPPPRRISLTLPTLNQTREVWFLVSGEDKADAVARSLATPTDSSPSGSGMGSSEDGASSSVDLPAHGILAPPAHGILALPAHGILAPTRWFLDAGAAARLP